MSLRRRTCRNPELEGPEGDAGRVAGRWCSRRIRSSAVTDPKSSALPARDVRGSPLSKLKCGTGACLRG